MQVYVTAAWAFKKTESISSLCAIMKRLQQASPKCSGAKKENNGIQSGCAKAEREEEREGERERTKHKSFTLKCLLGN